MIKNILLCFVFYSVIFAQEECPAQFMEARTCMEGIKDEIKKAQPQINTTAIEVDVKQCLKTHNCTVPNLNEEFEKEMEDVMEEIEEEYDDYFGDDDEDDDDDDKTSGGYGNPDMWYYNKIGKNQPKQNGPNLKKMKDKAKHCREELRKKLMEQSKGCIKDKVGFNDTNAIFPDATESEIDFEAYENIEGDVLDTSETENQIVEGYIMLKLGLMRKEEAAEHLKKMEKKIKMIRAYHFAAYVYENGTCPKEQIPNVAQCMRNVFSANVPATEICRNPIETALIIGKKHNDYCNKRKTCTDKISETCKAKKNDMSIEACECVSEKAIANGPEEFKKCMVDESQGKDKEGKPLGAFNIDKMRNYMDRNEYRKHEEDAAVETVDELCLRAEPHYNPCESTNKRTTQKDIKNKVHEKKEEHKSKMRRRK